MREDHVYDMVAVIGYNDDPVTPGRGSAIFLHLARPDMTPTAGCVGLAPDDLRAVLKDCTPQTHITILPPP
jgi:L,D-peptidoglycan transpeptidase YkuD (ErfK/YbiS/YcfS/YnhG family)